MTVYFIMNLRTNNIKIGYTTDEVKKRLKTLQTGNEDILYIYKQFRCFYGGFCCDLGHPSDCEANGKCVNFDSEQEKEDYDKMMTRLPYKYVLVNQGTSIMFKTDIQLIFFVRDADISWRLGKLYLLVSDGSRYELLLDLMLN